METFILAYLNYETVKVPKNKIFKKITDRKYNLVTGIYIYRP